MSHTFLNLSFEDLVDPPELGIPASWGGSLVSTGWESADYNYRDNQFTYSEQFDHANWTKTQCTISPNTVASPLDSTQIVGDELVEAVDVNLSHQIVQTKTRDAPRMTLSVYAKANGRDWIGLKSDNSAGTICFDLQNGLVGSVSGWSGLNVDASIEDVGGGWYRCSVSRDTTPGATIQWMIVTATSDGVTQYDGDATSASYIFGAQVSDLPALIEYVKTEASASEADDLPYENFERPWNDSEFAFATVLGNTEVNSYNSGLYESAFDSFEAQWSSNENFSFTLSLAETGAYFTFENWLTWSEQFDHTDWTASGGSISANVASGPARVSSGSPADRLVEDTSNGAHGVSQATTWAATEDLEFSCYIKADGRNWASLSVNDGGSNSATYWFNVSTGAVGTYSGSLTASASVEDVGDGWILCAIDVTNFPTGTLNAFASAATGDVQPTYVGSGASALQLFGAQVKRGSVTSSYKQTEATAGTFTNNAELFGAEYGALDYLDEFLSTDLEAASYDSAGTPESVEDFEELWGSNESFMEDWADVIAGPGVDAASYDDAGVPEDYEDFEETLFYKHSVVVDAAEDGDYIITINGHDHVFTADATGVPLHDETDIRDALVILINNGPAPVAALSSGSDTLRVQRTGNIRVAYTIGVVGPTPGDISLYDVPMGYYWTQTGQLASF